ncbi:MAG: FAD-binding oxidoreductase [Alphaproteobacteria bacterium HGW-Alphaproteobacteria-18]|nr:MAG: FAD-binding oxidoreductase [Alphaproteobacteria bacterium HGW-Alphaproteobacteria-18]
MISNALLYLTRKNLIETDARIIEPYCQGWRGERGKALFLARPRSMDELSEIVRTCIRNDIHLIPQSARTGLVGASVPDDSGQQGIVSLERLTSRFEFDRVNRSVTCSAGLRLSEVNARLKPDGLYLPIDLGADPCIGGMIATNTGGARLIRHGDMRRHVLELSVILGDADGTMVKLGSPLRKNATGPDWKHLFVGTGATFGIIGECTLSVERLPVHRAAALVPLPDETILPDFLIRLEEQFGSLISAIEFMSANAMHAAYAHVPSLKRPFGHDIPEMAVLVELSCDWPLAAEDRSLDDILLSGLCALWDETSGKLGAGVFGRAEEIWGIRHTLSEGVRRRGRLYAFDLAFRRSDTLRFRSVMTARLNRQFPGIEVCDFGHVGDGGLHFNLVDHLPADEWTPDRERAIRDFVIRAAVEEFGGSFSAEHSIGPVNQHYLNTFADDFHKSLASALEPVTSGRSFGRVHYSGINQR